MKVEIPAWAEGIKDEGMITFLAFIKRMHDIYGLEDKYTMQLDDAVRMCNKRAWGLVPWLQKQPQINANLEIGQPTDSTLCFRFIGTQHRRVKGRAVGRGRMPTPADQLPIEVELTDFRQQLIWMYILGSLNRNLISDEAPKFKLSNARRVPEIKLTRKAARGYIKKKDRLCDDEN